jgi:hypothetical protein
MKREVKQNIYDLITPSPYYSIIHHPLHHRKPFYRGGDRKQHV